jgi:hypothetical protein
VGTTPDPEEQHQREREDPHEPMEVADGGMGDITDDDADE